MEDASMINKKSLLLVALMAMMTVAYGQQDSTKITESDCPTLKAKAVWDTIRDTVHYLNEEAVCEKLITEGWKICSVRKYKDDQCIITARRLKKSCELESEIGPNGVYDSWIVKGDGTRVRLRRIFENGKIVKAYIGDQEVEIME